MQSSHCFLEQDRKMGISPAASKVDVDVLHQKSRKSDQQEAEIIAIQWRLYKFLDLTDGRVFGI